MSRHDGNKAFGGCLRKIDFCPKNSIFGLKKGSFGQSGPENSPPSSQMGTYRKTKGIQSCLRIWGSYDPIELSQPEPKKWGYMGVA